jgi:hypothetical protein
MPKNHINKPLLIATLFTASIFAGSAQLYQSRAALPPTVIDAGNNYSELSQVITEDSPEHPVAYNADSKANAPADDAQQAARQAAYEKYSQTYEIEVFNNERFVILEGKKMPVRVYKTQSLPNDPYADQWWVTSTNLDQAWGIPQGDHETLLAIIDTGFGLQHEEFAGRWHVNSLETGPATEENPSMLNCTDRGLALNMSCNLMDDNGDGIVDNEAGPTDRENPSLLNCTDRGLPLDKSCNLIDDSGNGLIDDVSGWDFVSHYPSSQAGRTNPAGEGTTHGSRVAGVAAATGNNGRGIAGVDWNTNILPIQAIDDDGYGDTLSVGRAIYYAAAQGADVINMSLGTPYDDPFVRQAVQAAIAAGSIVVAASGNDGCDCVLYPANYPEVLAVGALNTSNERASFSSWGANLDVMAPGLQMITSNWTPTNPTNSYVSGAAGTSFASPVIAGMLTRLKSNQPDATPVQVIAALMENLRRLSIPGSAARSDTLGFGGLDALKATNRIVQPASSSLLYALSPLSKGDRLGTFQPVESENPYHVYVCEQPIYGAVPVYELVNAASRFYSVSEVERQRAAASGYSSTRIAYGCVTQAHDNNDSIRLINIFSELKNAITSKN